MSSPWRVLAGRLVHHPAGRGLKRRAVESLPVLRGRTVGRDASEIALVGGHLEKGVGTGGIANALPVASSTTRSVGARLAASSSSSTGAIFTRTTDRARP